MLQQEQIYDREIFFWFRGRRNIGNSLINNEEYLRRLDGKQTLAMPRKYDHAMTLIQESFDTTGVVDQICPKTSNLI